MGKHSNVFYIYKDSGFQAVEKATGYRNPYGLDLFRYEKDVYEGRSGCRLYPANEEECLKSKIAALGGAEKLSEIISAQIAKTGESPRYTHPEERKQDIFPPDPEKENTVFAKSPYGGSHYYYRLYNENGIEIFILKNDKAPYRPIYVQCDGYMIQIGQNQQLDNALKWLAGLDNGVRGELERQFNESMADSERWADIGFATVLGRVADAAAHNKPILEAHKRQNRQWEAEREAKRTAERQAAKEAYEKTVKAAEEAILSENAVENIDVQGKSLLMLLFRKYAIDVPLRTQNWIINSLADIYFIESGGRWSYHYSGNNSTVFRDYLPRLIVAVQGGASQKENT